ncbi:unnamed protein product [Cylicocyclus nassatus]|uniref:Secreted protein n=1 Tax=Cylicocyclus nassatus TaxID=53992 RepID=A0AA36MCS3_CYLNA|nr:unnamed protein product [Cylicocyclus nassatus]
MYLAKINSLYLIIALLMMLNCIEARPRGGCGGGGGIASMLRYIKLLLIQHQCARSIHARSWVHAQAIFHQPGKQHKIYFYRACLQQSECSPP